MNYVSVKRTIKDKPHVINVTFDPQGWGEKHDVLYDQTPVGLNDIWSAESYNNFNNPFARAMQAVHNERGNCGLTTSIVTRDVVVGSGAEIDRKGLKIKAYKTRAGTDLEVVHTDLTIPNDGYFVPTDDGMFHPDTGVPFETVDSKREAERRWQERGFNLKYLSKLSMPAGLSENETKFAVRTFRSSINRGGIFYVRLDWYPTDQNFDMLASLPPYEDKPVFEVNL